MVHRAIEQAARRVGPALFGWDDLDEVEEWRNPRWLQASRAAYGAALALGSPELLRAEQNAVPPAVG
jgi:hypothetical protein